MVHRERGSAVPEGPRGTSTLQLRRLTERDAFHPSPLTEANGRTEADAESIAIDLGHIERTGLLRWVDAGFKRLVDVLLSATALAAAAPVLLVVWLAIRLTSPGPAIYRHRRIGRGGRYFECLKFRTMVQDADRQLERVLAENPDLRDEFDQTQKLRRDPRVTRIGNVLRKTSLDELPQFFNVLKGDMSIVGPRPIVDEEMERYGRWLPLILALRPGITGLWQVSGRNDTTYAERIALDRRYVLTRNVASDFSIMLKTPAVMVKRDGAY